MKVLPYDVLHIHKGMNCNWIKDVTMVMTYTDQAHIDHYKRRIELDEGFLSYISTLWSLTLSTLRPIATRDCQWFTRSHTTQYYLFEKGRTHSPHHQRFCWLKNKTSKFYVTEFLNICCQSIRLTYKCVTVPWRVTERKYISSWLTLIFLFCVISSHIGL